MEDDLNGRQPQCKTTTAEDNLIGRKSKWKYVGDIRHIYPSF